MRVHNSPMERPGATCTKLGMMWIGPHPERTSRRCVTPSRLLPVGDRSRTHRPRRSSHRPRPEETPRNEFLSQHKNEIAHVGREFRLVGRTGARHVVGIRTDGFREDVPAHPARCWFPTSLVTPFHHRWRTRSSAAVPVTFDGMPQDPDQPNRVKVDTH